MVCFLLSTKVLLIDTELLFLRYNLNTWRQLPAIMTFSGNY